MAQVFLDAGVNEREPTSIGDRQVQGCSGAEYRVGEVGLFSARGRSQVATVGTTGVGLYEAGFDGTSAQLIAHAGNTLHAGQIIAGTITMTPIRGLPDDSLPVVGSHYANRHYLATNVENRRLEIVGDSITNFPIGMSQTTFAVGVSVTQGAGSLSATTGLEYWVTEYDSARGIESLHGDTAHTGAFSSLDSVIITATGTSSNPQADTLRWYRSTDGGGYPDGGLIQETAIGTTQITDTDTTTGTLSVPNYGIISIGGLDTDRDEAPPVFSVIFGPYQDSMLGVPANDLRTLRFTPAGFPDSWPSAYGIPLETPRRDEIVTGVVLGQRIGVFTKDSVHVVYRLPRDSDSIFAAGEAQNIVTLDRGCVSRRGACVFTVTGRGTLVAWVARDGIWVTNLTPNQYFPVTDIIRWPEHVDIAELSSCRLVNDTDNRRLVFIHRRKADTTHSTGIWYFDYQRFAEFGLRPTFANHGPLADGVTIPYVDGLRQLATIDSRSGNGQIYVESVKDSDDSQLVDANGSVLFRVRTKEYMPGGAGGSVALGRATWMHGAGPADVTHRFYQNRDAHPQTKKFDDSTKRQTDRIELQKGVNSFSLEIESTGTVPYGIHWVDVVGLDVGQLGGLGGA